ncbi:peptidase [Pasteurellaceae bacterium Orientalotternb1]|nr:peptidase [Pasteurellaceae bacterium Orientalotternb1]
MKLTKMEIMKLGKHTAVDGREVSFSAADLTDLVNSYDPTLFESPIVIGHPQLTSPAYGWVREMSFEGDTLFATVGQIDAAFADAVNEGRYKKRSASIFLPNSLGNPKPGHFYLRHIGFLGGVPPAVKGLADVSFAANTEGEDAFVDFAFATNPQPNPKEDNSMKTDKEKTDAEKAVAQREAELNAREAALKDRENKVAAAETENAQKAQQAAQQAATDFAAQLVKDGKVLPAQKAGLIEVMVKLGNEPVSFSDGTQTISKSALDVLKEVLSQKPVDFAEKAGEEGEPEEAVDFADPSAIANAAIGYQQEQANKGIHISMTDAVNHITKGAKK